MNKDYVIKNGQITFGSKKIKNADIESFKKIADNFAIDKKHIYYKGNSTALDPFDFEMCGNYHVKDKKAVYYILKTKLKKIAADPLTFESIGEGFTKDKSYHFCHDKRIRVKDKATFKVLKNGYAIDKINLYYLTEQFKLHVPSETSSIKIIDYAQDSVERLVIIGKTVFLHNSYGMQPMPGTDPETIRFINRYYIVDDQNFYYEGRPFAKNSGQKTRTIDRDQSALVLDKKVFLNGDCVKDIDSDTFCVLGDYYFDKQCILNYYERKNTHKIQPFDPSGLSSQEVVKSINQLLKMLFYIFDNYIPITKLNEEIKERYHTTKMPIYTIAIENSTIHIHYENQIISGTISAFLSLVSPFWSIARNRSVLAHPIKRLIYNEQDYDDGYYLIDFVQKAIGEHLVKIATYFFYRDEKEEALLITHKLFRDLTYWRERALELLRICPYEILAQTPLVEEDTSCKTTNLARAKEILSFLGDDDLFKRLHYAKEMFGLIAATGNIDGFYTPVFLSLIEQTKKETNEHIKEVLFGGLDLAVTIFFRHLGREKKKAVGIYKKAYPIIRFLLENHINTDFNQARLWECATVLNKQQDVNQAYSALEGLIKQDIGAPAMWWNESAYPNYRAWEVDASLRIGTLQSKEKAISTVQKAFQILNHMRLHYNAHAVGISFTRLQNSIVKLCEIHHIDSPFQDYTSKKRLSGYSNLVSTIVEADFIVTGHQLLRYGRYCLKNEHILLFNLKLIKEGAVQKVSLNDWIGMDYLLDGQPWGRQFKSQVAVYHPRPIKGEAVTVYTDQYTQLGLKSSFYWHFEDEEELQAGPWRIEISFPEVARFKDVHFMVEFELLIEIKE